MASERLAQSLTMAVERAIGRRVERVSIVRGGDVAAAFRLELVGGGDLFAKTHPSPPPGFFTTEATGLSWLREANAVSVPEVVAVSDGSDESDGSDGSDDSEGSERSPPFLVLGWIDEGRPTASTEADLGHALAALHDAGAPSFGREDRRTTGSRGLPNDPHPTWAGFYAECRLIPLARLAATSEALPSPAIAKLEQLATKLDRYDDGERASRLHGDLWGGNRLVDRSGQSWLIDPAAHGGHREFDLAMMRLFGGFSAACFRAYEERRPLAPGWEDRVPLHQIAPLVVHAIKFGGGYVPAAVAAITQF